MPTGAGVNHTLRTWGWARSALHFPANARYRENRLLGPLWEGAPAAAGGGENFAAIRNISGYGKVLSLRPCGATSLAEGGKGIYSPSTASITRSQSSKDRFVEQGRLTMYLR